MNRDAIIDDEIRNKKFHRCYNPDCDMYVAGNVQYCCFSCQMGHALGKQIAHDGLCHERRIAQVKAWGWNVPPFPSIDTIYPTAPQETDTHDNP